MKNKQFYGGANVKGKEYSCNSRWCKSNCCSDFFLKVNQEQEQSVLKDRFFIVENDYGDFTLIGYREGLSLERIDKRTHIIRIDDGIEFELKHNPHNKVNYIYIQKKCDKLLSNGRCKIYRSRPQICRSILCPVQSDRPEIKWFAKNSEVLKNVNSA